MSPRVPASLLLFSLTPLALLGAGALTLAPTGHGQESGAVTFQSAAWSIGDRVDSKETWKRAIDFVASVDGEEVGEFPQSGTEFLEKRTEILAVQEGKPVKVRIHYDAHRETNEGPGQEEGGEDKKSPLEGNSFVLELREGQVFVQDDEGGTVEAEIEKLIREKETTGGRLDVGTDQIEAFLAEKPRKIGERIEVPEEIALEVFGEENEFEKVSLSFELSEVRDIDGVACGVFKTKIELEGSEDELDIELDLEGETWIAVETARPHGAELSGSVRVSGEVSADAGGVDLRGEGTMEISQSLAYASEK